ncbi:GTPase Era [Mycoplasmopsis gallinarum]|uniref:GTPase Era n=1 Tax=Mycoplasmopsis gallinarum TaxID=29557 RepID=UPI0004828815|nr:GTPase Era [Mycoplasmopsis gallinarum]
MKILFASILGRPNVGKSSLLNKILNYKLSIVSPVAQTTRDQITGIYNDENYQIVFTDTPGIHKAESLLGEVLNKNALSTIKDEDVVLFLTPINEKIGSGDEFIIEKIKLATNKIAVITKIDLAKSPEEIQEKVNELNKFDFNKIISVSDKNEKSIDMLMNILKEYAYEGDPFYDTDSFTTTSMRFLAKEILRESAINHLYDELPHSIAIEINDFIEFEEDKFQITATIFVKKASQKGMLIGKNGSMIKKIGMEARKKMQILFNGQVTLQTKVKIANKWINDEKALKKLGYE